MKKKVLILPLLAFTLIGCGKLSCTASIDKEVKYVTEKTGNSEAYYSMCYNICADEGSAKKVTKSNFYAKVNNKKVEAKCLFNSVSLNYPSYYYDKIIEEKEIKVNKSESGSYQSTSVYVGFANDSGVTNESEFYINDIKLSTTPIAITL